MQRLMIAGAAAVVLMTASPASAQTTTIPGKTEVLTATVEADVDENSRAVVPANERTAGTAGTASHQRTITATITAIDPSVPSITFSGPNGWKYSSRVQDTAALAKVKVGDKVDITWTEAMLVSLEPEK